MISKKVLLSIGGGKSSSVSEKWEDGYDAVIPASGVNCAAIGGVDNIIIPEELRSGYRLQERAQRERLKTKPGHEYVQQKLRIGWTPELIAGRIKPQGELPSVCHESIYQYIYCVADRKSVV